MPDDAQPIVSRLDQLLQVEIRSVHDDADDKVARLLHQGANLFLHENAFDPLFAALHGKNPGVANVIISAIIERSRIYFYKGSILDGARTRQALEENLFGRRENDHKDNTGHSPLYVAAGNPVKEMLKTAWDYFEGKVDINQPSHNGSTLAHAAAIYPDNLEYLLARGARVDDPDAFGVTPVMHMLECASIIPTTAIADRLFKIYESQKFNVRAVDEEGHGLAFYALNNIVSEGDKPVQFHCIGWALAQGVDFILPDRNGKTPVDYFMDREQKSETIETVFSKLAERGFNTASLKKKYTRKPHFFSVTLVLEARRKSVCRNLEQLEHMTELWKPDGTPSPLLIDAFGYGAAGNIFEHRSVRNKPEDQMALYQKMEATLPPQCKEFLHTGMDLPFLRDVAKPPPAPGVLGALRRKSSDKPGAGNPGRP